MMGKTFIETKPHNANIYWWQGKRNHLSSKSLAWMTLGLVLSLFFVSKPILPQLFTGLFSYRNQASFWQTSLQVHTTKMTLMLVTPLMRMLKMMASDNDVESQLNDCHAKGYSAPTSIWGRQRRHWPSRLLRASTPALLSPKPRSLSTSLWCTNNIHMI